MVTKQQNIKLFHKLYEKSARRRRNWIELINSLEKEEVLTKNQAEWRRQAWFTTEELGYKKK